MAGVHPLTASSKQSRRLDQLFAVPPMDELEKLTYSSPRARLQSECGSLVLHSATTSPHFGDPGAHAVWLLGALTQPVHCSALLLGVVEQLGEGACCHAGADVSGVPGVVEEVGVYVECDGDPCVAEDAADLRDVEPEVDDQVAGERVAQVVEAQRRPAVLVEPGGAGGALEHR